MNDAIAPGTKQVIDGTLRVYYDGHWIKAYDVPESTLEHKKQLIEALTRRLFNHVEHGINLPGHRLAEARAAYESERDPDLKRVKGAMLAGALFNRATDIFKKVVELEEVGVKIELDNALLRECGDHLKEALSLGRLVLHRSGEEGIDELWGEPLKAFSFPVSEFYKSRYIKIAQTWTAIDRITEELCATMQTWTMFAGVEPLLREFSAIAKRKCETLRTDPDIFEMWPRFVVASERLDKFTPKLPPHTDPTAERAASQGVHLIRAARALIWSMTRARVAMPKSTESLLERCQALRAAAPKAREVRDGPPTGRLPRAAKRRSTEVGRHA